MKQSLISCDCLATRNDSPPSANGSYRVPCTRPVALEGSSVSLRRLLGQRHRHWIIVSQCLWAKDWQKTLFGKLTSLDLFGPCGKPFARSPQTLRHKLTCMHSLRLVNLFRVFGCFFAHFKKSADIGYKLRDIYSDMRSCVKVEVAVLGSPSLIT